MACPDGELRSRQIEQSRTTSKKKGHEWLLRHWHVTLFMFLLTCPLFGQNLLLTPKNIPVPLIHVSGLDLSFHFGKLPFLKETSLITILIFLSSFSREDLSTACYLLYLKEGNNQNLTVQHSKYCVT